MTTRAPTNADLETRLSKERTALSTQRTRDALERTLMSWIRTALSMIGFGFGLFKVLQYMVHAERGMDATSPSTEALNLALIALGTALLILAMAQYHVAMRALQRSHGVERRLPLPLIGAGGVSLIGVLAMAYLISERFN